MKCTYRITGQCLEEPAEFWTSLSQMLHDCVFQNKTVFRDFKLIINKEKGREN